jgi:hypothetical protein
MKTLILLAAAALSLSTCEQCPPPHIPTPDKDAGAVPDPVLPPGTDPAEAACKKLEELKCMSKDGRPLWEPTPGGVSCPDVFRNAEKNGVNLHPACIATMKACEERDACTDKN